MLSIRHFKYKGRLKVKGWSKIHHVNTNQKIHKNSDKADFRPIKVTRDKEGYYIMIKVFNFPRTHNNPLHTCA